MSTLGDLIGSIASSLHSYTGVQEASTHLTSSVLVGDLSFPVDSSDQVMRGISEVDDELVYVNVSDSNLLTIAPYGRGYRGSTAAAHSANAQLTFDPMFPRCEIRRAIDQAILALYPTLFQVKKTTFAYTILPIMYALPADADNVLEVKFQSPSDPYDYWAPLFNWSDDTTSPEATGKTLYIFDAVPPGSTIQVVYQAPFSSFVTSADTLTSVGVKEDWADLLTYSVTARMVRFLDPARLQLNAVENLGRSQVVAAGDAGKVANQLYAMYQQRLAEERRKLLTLTPTRINYTR